MKVLSHTSWGVDRTVLLHLYRSLIRSKLDYGAIVYGSAPKSYLAMLDTVHHQGLRLALGAFRTSPVESLYVEADEPSLYLRREKLALQYAIRLAANPSNPAYKITFLPHISEDIVNIYENKPSVIKSFGLRIQQLLTSAKINLNTIEEHSVPEIPSWCIRKRSVVFSLHSWNETPFNKLKEIKPVIKESKSVISNIRREEVVLTRLRIGHTRITHSWLLNRDEQPNCIGCDVPFTVKHFLLDCFDIN